MSAASMHASFVSDAWEGVGDLAPSVPGISSYSARTALSRSQRGKAGVGPISAQIHSTN